MRLAKVAGPVLKRLPAGDGPSRGDQWLEDRAARSGAVVRSAPFGRGPRAEVPQSAWARRRVRQERRGSGRDAEARLRLRRGRHADAAASRRQRPPAAVPLAGGCRGHQPLRLQQRRLRAGARAARAAPARPYRRQSRRQQGCGRPGGGLCARRQDLRWPRRLSDHQHLVAQHAGIARSAAARGARRSDRPGGRGARRDRAAPPADAQDRARSRRPRA